MAETRCTALVIAAPASGQGKTTLTATLAWFYRRQGKRVRLFKMGPDFLDPTILAQASGHPVYQLDLWMVGQSHCQQLLAEAAEHADLILIEGVMGLFDGDPSTADFATAFNIPVMAIIDGSAMAQTFAAVAYGLAHFSQTIRLAGIVANRVGSARHAEILKLSLSQTTPLLATLPRQQAGLPSRYLGLVQAEELDNLPALLDQLADDIQLNPDFQFPSFSLTELADTRVNTNPDQLLKGVRIGVARDAAFAFIYQANLDCLRQLGAEICFFSPLADSQLPDVDSLYLPGGYPELHLATLSANQSLAEQIRQHIASDKPVLAECGGMLYLCESLTDKDGQKATMCGVLNADAVLQKRFTALALQQVTVEDDSLRGHTYHHSLLTTKMLPHWQGVCPNGNTVSEAVYQQQRLTASYIHFYFPSCPQRIAEWLKP